MLSSPLMLASWILFIAAYTDFLKKRENDEICLLIVVRTYVRLPKIL